MKGGETSNSGKGIETINQIKEITMTTQKQNQESLRLVVRVREDFQKIRKSINNRLGLKKVKLTGKEGEKRLVYEIQDIPDRDLPEADRDSLLKLSLKAMLDEIECVKTLSSILKRIPVYNSFLNTKEALGCKDIVSGWMLAEFDINEATTVSKMWQFAGLNSGLIRGRKSVKKKDYKDKMGDIVGTLPKTKDGSERVAVLTYESVRGDKATPGFLLPYNKNLKRVLMGILATNFIKTQGRYCQEFYYPMKLRYANSENEVLHGKKMMPWKDVTPLHRDFAAKRYMIKQFLINFYVAWRTSEGLPVREPYQEEYLGKKHQQKRA